MNNSFAAAHPELVCEWSEKNLPLMPDKITYGSNKIVWWKANCGHEWQTSVKSRSAGEKCPICSGARVVEGINDLATLKPELARQWSKKNKLKPTQVSLGSHKKVIWKCKHGHEWEASVKSRAVNGTGCPYCSHNKILAGFNDLASQYPEIAAEWSERNHPLEPTMVTAFANRKVWWKCSKGHEWNTLISTRSGGSKCPYCSGILLLKGFNDFATMHPSFAEEWSERNLPLTPDMVNEKSRKNVCWKCKVCGFEWKSLVQSRVKGTVCPVCADRAVLTGYNDLATTDTYLLQEWDYVQENCDLEQSDNVVIYGHHMKNGSMFSDLCKYESEDFYQAHKNVHFDTLADFGEYEIVAAFKTVAYSQEGFKYYHFVNAEDEAAFDEFIAECKSLALYDTGVSAEYGDKLITLSTCEYSRTNGRMVIVAKLVVPSAEEVDADAGH